MNRKNKLDLLFQNKKRDLLSIFFTAGYPEMDDTARILECTEKYGADLVEIGIPFSDPVADGRIIQDSSMTALRNGMTLARLFSQLDEAVSRVNIPRILMGYFNPIHRFGVEEFCRACRRTGVDGVIIPDLPLEEYNEKYRDFFVSNGLHFILLITPQTSDERIMEISDNTTAFIYMVSGESTTGGGADLESKAGYFKKVREITDKPLLIGFGIKDSETFSTACRYSDGAIVGSSFISALAGGGELEGTIRAFINTIRRLS
jgi:tryptophan synthase alpha chain